MHFRYCASGKVAGWSGGWPVVRNSANFRRDFLAALRTAAKNSPALTCAEQEQAARMPPGRKCRSEEHTSELQSQSNLVCRLLLEKKKNDEEGWHAHAT